ncbi:MAG: glycosyltransferase family protein [Myxococcota bacterium]
MCFDRVGDAYQGLMGEAEAEKTRTRIDWMCSQAKGQKVLDVGCSQGIGALLLAREGFEVIGIDVDAEAIETATKMLEEESKTTRSRARFLQVALDDFDEAPGSFDTILMGEFIEHLSTPETAIAKAYELAAPDGLIVVTTPFGLFRHPDHRQTYYVDRLLQLLGPYFEGRHLDVDGPYLRYVGVRLEKAPRSASLSSLRAELGGDAVSEMEQAAYEDRERRLTAGVDELKAKRKGHYEALQKSRAKVNSLSERLDGLRQENARLRESEKRLEELLDDLRTERESWHAERREVEKVLSALTRRPGEIGKESGTQGGALDERIRSIRGVLVRWDEESGKLSQENRRLKALLDSRQKQLDVVNQRLQRAQERFERLRDSNRFRMGHYFWEAARSPRAVAALPVRLVKLGVDAVRGRARSDEPLTASHRQPGQKVTLAPESPTSTFSEGPVLLTAGRASRPLATQDLWVAAILDEMSEACLRPECNLITFTPNNWRKVLEERPPHLLFVESAWRGNGGSWQHKVGTYNHPDSGGLEEVVRWCRSHGIPTVFWNKEDPVHFDKFKQAARLFDHIFTTDAECVPRYRTLKGSRAISVGDLPFAAQPSLHNPVASGPRDPAPCFAGSYYGNRHHARRLQQEELLDAARDLGLVIYDRNHGSARDEFDFPDRFSPHIRGRLDYEALCRVYRQHKVFLNVNSVTDSPTMLSRRVFELLACGTVVVSTPSRAMEEIFGDLVPVVRSREEAACVLRGILDDPLQWQHLSRRGWRFVLSSHTYAHRLAKVATAAGLKVRSKDDLRVALLALLHLPEDAHEIIRLATTSSPSEIIVSAPSAATAEAVEKQLEDALPQARVRALSRDLGSADPTRESAMLTDCPWLLIAGPRDPPADVQPLLVAARFAEAQVIGFAEQEDQAHSYGPCLNRGPFLVKRSLIASRGWVREGESPADICRRWQREGVRTYAADPPETPAMDSSPRQEA